MFHEEKYGQIGDSCLKKNKGSKSFLLKKTRDPCHLANQDKGASCVAILICYNRLVIRLCIYNNGLRILYHGLYRLFIMDRGFCELRIRNNELRIRHIHNRLGILSKRKLRY